MSNIFKISLLVIELNSNFPITYTKFQIFFLELVSVFFENIHIATANWTVSFLRPQANKAHFPQPMNITRLWRHLYVKYMNGYIRFLIRNHLGTHRRKRKAEKRQRKTIRDMRIAWSNYGMLITNRPIVDWHTNRTRRLFPWRIRCRDETRIPEQVLKNESRL